MSDWNGWVMALADARPGRTHAIPRGVRWLIGVGGAANLVLALGFAFG